MLVLRRKAGEAIVFNKVIKVRVLAIDGERVKLGIDAPPDVNVVREELLVEAREIDPFVYTPESRLPAPTRQRRPPRAPRPDEDEDDDFR